MFMYLKKSKKQNKTKNKTKQNKKQTKQNKKQNPHIDWRQKPFFPWLNTS